MDLWNLFIRSKCQRQDANRQWSESETQTGGLIAQTAIYWRVGAKRSSTLHVEACEYKRQTLSCYFSISISFCLCNFVLLAWQQQLLYQGNQLSVLSVARIGGVNSNNLILLHCKWNWESVLLCATYNMETLVFLSGLLLKMPTLQRTITKFVLKYVQSCQAQWLPSRL